MMQIDVVSKDGDRVSVVLRKANSWKFAKNRRIPSGDIELVLGFDVSGFQC